MYISSIFEYLLTSVLERIRSKFYKDVKNIPLRWFFYLVGGDYSRHPGSNVTGGIPAVGGVCLLGWPGLTTCDQVHVICEFQKHYRRWSDTQAQVLCTSVISGPTVMEVKISLGNSSGASWTWARRRYIKLPHKFYGEPSFLLNSQLNGIAIDCHYVSLQRREWD